MPKIVSRNGDTGLSYQLYLITKNSEAIPLNPDESIVIYRMGRAVNPYKKLGLRMAKFLNIPFKEQESPQFNNTFSYLKSTFQSLAPLIKQEIDKQKPNVPDQ